MTSGGVPIFCAMLACLLGVAAISDLRGRTVANDLSLAIAALAPGWWWATGQLTPAAIGWQLGLAGTVFALFFAQWHFGLMGAGDVKLIGALALWFPPLATLNWLLVMAIAGAVIALGGAMLHRLRGAQGRYVVPYALAIAAGGLTAVHQQYLYHSSIMPVT